MWTITTSAQAWWHCMLESSAELGSDIPIRGLPRWPSLRAKRGNRDGESVYLHLLDPLGVELVFIGTDRI